MAVEDAGPCRGAECNDIWGNSAAPVASRVPFSPKKAYATLQHPPCMHGFMHTTAIDWMDQIHDSPVTDLIHTALAHAYIEIAVLQTTGYGPCEPGKTEEIGR